MIVVLIVVEDVVEIRGVLVVVVWYITTIYSEIVNNSYVNIIDEIIYIVS